MAFIKKGVGRIDAGVAYTLQWVPYYLLIPGYFLRSSIPIMFLSSLYAWPVYSTKCNFGFSWKPPYQTKAF
jgi:hypothetical protein